MTEMINKYAPDLEIDAICDDFERALHGSETPQIESFLERVDESRQGSLLYWLISLELNRPSDDPEATVVVSDYVQRFPKFLSVVEDVLSGASPTVVGTESLLPSIPGYSLEALIKRGGQGAVYRALQDHTGQYVAIKLLSENELARVPQQHRAKVIERLKQEIQIAASLKHANVVRIYDAGECSAGFYYVMQLVEGGSLADRASSLSQVEAARYIAEIADAVHESHASDVLHLDIKPHNILFDVITQRPLLADFGLARFLQESSRSGVVAGTLGYMAPEQAWGEPQGKYTDVYGLGATLFFLLTGTTPQIERQQLLDKGSRQAWAPRHPRELNPSINPQLEAVCLKCLQIQPEDRFQDCVALVEALKEVTATEDGHRIAETGRRTILCSPVFLVINLAVTLQLQLGWEAVPHTEVLIWLTMFSMYAVVYFVFSSASQADRHSAESLAITSMKAIWLSKMFAAIAIAVSLRMLVGGESQDSLSVERAVLMSYPMFSALTGMVLASLAPRYWRPFYFLAAVWWIFGLALVWTIAQGLLWAPALYGAAATAAAAIWGNQLRRFAREKSAIFSDVPYVG